jgi:hypothetical protein
MGYLADLFGVFPSQMNICISFVRQKQALDKKPDAITPHSTSHCAFRKLSLQEN